MTIRINGTLVIKEIKGANGKFCVGDLNTPLGEFKVKEPILDACACPPIAASQCVETK